VRQRGFTLYIVLAALLAFSGMAVALKVQSSRLEACKQDSAAFRADVQAKGEAAQREAAVKNAENAKRKEKSDAERKRLIIANNGLADRLRDNAARSSLPETRTVTGIPDGTACYNLGILDNAIRAFTTGTAAIATEGQLAADELANAREWARR
jgi:hypothetical protein